MRLSLALTLAVATSSPLVAQADHTVVFPQDLAAKEGNSSNNLVLNQPYIRSFVNTTGFTVTGMNPANNASALTVSVTGAPPVSPIVFLFGDSDPNVTLPGWCGPIRALPLVALPIGASDASGILSASLPTGAWNGAAWGAPLYTQAVTPDSTQTPVPVSVSNGELLILPNIPVDVRSTNSTTFGATTGLGPANSGLVFEISDT